MHEGACAFATKAETLSVLVHVRLTEISANVLKCKKLSANKAAVL